MKKFLIITTLLLSACQTNPLPQTTSTLKDETQTSTQPVRAKIADFFYPEVDHEHVITPPAVVKTQPTCYSTWDKPVCYEAPQRAIDGSMLAN